MLDLNLDKNVDIEQCSELEIIAVLCQGYKTVSA
jgi:hypothetical protein